MAAGYSRRFGNEDKRLTRLPDGRSLLAASMTRAGEAFPRLRVVLRDDDDPVALGLLASTPVIRVTRAERGLGASLGEAIETLDHDAALVDIEAVAVLLGDMPAIRLETLLPLNELASRSRIVRPCHAGRPGHPVFFGRDFWPELATLDNEAGAREVIHRHAERYREIAVDDPGVCRDIDTRDDLVGLHT